MLSPLAFALATAGCGGGKTRTETVENTRTVVRTVTAPSGATTAPSTPATGTSPTPTTPPIAAGPRSCGRIDVTYPNGEGGSSAVNIVALGLGCGDARAVTRACQRGNVTPGWSAHRNGNSGVRMTSGARRITFLLAGGGGCVPGP